MHRASYTIVKVLRSIKMKSYPFMQNAVERDAVHFLYVCVGFCSVSHWASCAVFFT